MNFGNHHLHRDQQSNGPTRAASLFLTSRYFQLRRPPAQRLGGDSNGSVAGSAGRRRLFCACDARVLVEVNADSGEVLTTEGLAGVPDVVFFNAALSHLYVAIGDPGIIEVFGTTPLRRHEVISTEAGAHTLAFDASRNIVCAFLPESHRAAAYEDRP